MRGPVICGIEDAGDEHVAVAARGLAKQYDLRLLFVHVRDGSDGQEHAAALLRTTGDDDLAVEEGHAADRLVELARDEEASFLVVGNHGPRSSLLGSVSADVARRAPCPVLVVPPSAQAPPSMAASGSGLRGGIVRL